VVLVHGVDVAAAPRREALSAICRRRRHDRLLGEQLITFSGMMFRPRDAARRVADLLRLLDLERGRPARRRLLRRQTKDRARRRARPAPRGCSCSMSRSGRSIRVGREHPRHPSRIREGARTVVVSSHSMDCRAHVRSRRDHVRRPVLVSGTMTRCADRATSRRLLDLIGGRRRGEGPACCCPPESARSFVNTLRRNTFQLVAVIVGAALTASMVAVVLASMFASSLPPEVTNGRGRGGAALVFGWLVAAAVRRVDRTLIRSGSHRSRCARLG
jgi:hypothetical protein